MGGHSRLAPSAAARWGRCAGSVNLIAKLGLDVDDGGNEFSREGTAAHEVAAACLNSGHDAWTCVGDVRIIGGHKVPVSPEMTEGVQVYLDYARSIKPTKGGGFVEHSVGLPELHPDLRGTLDLGVIHVSEATLEIVDLKFGFGVVEPENNPQLMTYGASLLSRVKTLYPKIVYVKFTIAQPRAPHPKGPIRSWTVYAKDLEKWAVEVLGPAAHATDKPDAPLAPGDHCHDYYCPARNQCPALRANFLADVAALEAAPAQPEGLNSVELGSLIARFSALKDRMKMFEDEAFSRLMRSEAVPGLKLVTMRANRVWKDGAEATAVATFGDKAYVKKLKTPPALEKEPGGKVFVSEWAHTPQAGLTMAPESDKRPAAAPPANAAQVFAEHTQKGTEDD